MMFCRSAWHRLAPLTRTTLTPLARNAVPTRQMSFGLPASGTNIAFVVLGGSSLTAALVYAYKTINSDSARYNERIAEIEARAKSEGGVGTTVAKAAPVAEVTAVVESAAAEPVLEEVAAEPTLAAANEAESVIAAAVEVDLAAEAASVTAEAAAPAADEPTAPVMEDAAAAESPASVAETTAHPISDLLSTVKIIAGGAVEIAAASVGDQHLVASVRLAEKNAGETLNGLEVAGGKEEVPGEVSDTKEAVDGEAMVRRFDTEEVELEELNKAPEDAEDATVSAVDYVELYEDNPVAVLFEDPASLQETSETLASTEMEDVSGLAEPASPVMTSEDDVMSAVGDVLDTVEAAVLDEEIEEVKAYHESAETEAIDITAPQALQTSTTAEDISFSEATLNALDETKSSEYSEEGNDS